MATPAEGLVRPAKLGFITTGVIKLLDIRHTFLLSVPWLLLYERDSMNPLTVLCRTYYLRDLRKIIIITIIKKMIEKKT